MGIRDLSRRERNSFLEKHSAVLSQLLGENELEAMREEGRIRTLELGGYDFYLIGDDNILVEVGDIVVPTIFQDYNGATFERIPSLTVDRGAVPHITNGADVMRPGVREFNGSFRKGDLISVKEETYRKMIAIVRALEDYETCLSMSKGKVASSAHYVGDNIWKSLQEGWGK